MPCRCSALLLVLSLYGCGPTSLPDVPIVGASPALEDALRQELTFFEEAVGEGRARVSRVVVKDLGDSGGRFNPVSHRIGLHENLDTERMVWVLRHELCHALDDTSGPFFMHSGPLIGRLAEGLEASDLVLEDATCRTDSCWRDEAFAGLCTEGPWTADALSEACEGEPSDLDTAMRVMREKVWLGSPPIASQPIGSEVARFSRAEGADWATASGVSSPGVAQLWWSRPELEGTLVAWVDVWTGTELPFGGSDGDAWEQIGRPEHVPAGAPDGSLVGPVGWSDGPVLASTRLEGMHLGSFERWVVSDGQEWSLLGDGCHTEASPPFVADGAVFALSLDGGELSWNEVLR